MEKIEKAHDSVNRLKKEIEQHVKKVQQLLERGERVLGQAEKNLTKLPADKSAPRRERLAELGRSITQSAEKGINRATTAFNVAGKNLGLKDHQQLGRSLRGVKATAPTILTEGIKYLRGLMLEDAHKRVLEIRSGEGDPTQRELEFMQRHGYEYLGSIEGKWRQWEYDRPWTDRLFNFLDIFNPMGVSMKLHEEEMRRQQFPDPI